MDGFPSINPVLLFGGVMMFSIEKTMEVLKNPEVYAPHVRREAATRAIGILDKLAERDDETEQSNTAEQSDAR